ncbi:hypothetical protein WDV06_14805 [Streptomyces racemochromogenes]|uniref:Uncharacterized protein n=1 Tax=Streptomyces racemochromogenes TaxID=67353 RepID=A0ABW7PD86_9ACTN
MHRTLPRLAAPLALAAALTASACLPASAAQTPSVARTSPALLAGSRAPAPAGISGWARMAYGDPRDDVQISVDAHGLFGPAGSTTATRSWGVFRVQHYSPAKDGQPENFNWGDFVVDCLRIDGAAGGTEVSVTGRIVDAGQAWSPFLDRKPLPARMGLGFHLPGPGGRPDEARVGLTPPAAEGGPDIARCATGPADSGLTAGGYRLGVSS